MLCRLARGSRVRVRRPSMDLDEFGLSAQMERDITHSYRAIRRKCCFDKAK